jgi:hypothetical protein
MWTGLSTHIGETTSAYRILSGIPEENGSGGSKSKLK